MQRRLFLAAAPAVTLGMPALAQPERSRVLRFVPQADLAILDPIFTPAPTTSTHGYYVFDTLYSTAADGVPRPQMAEGHSISDDKRSWRIRLREGLFFHDGTPVLASDCAASLARWSKRDPFGLILADAVDNWGVADDRTVEIKLKRPFPLLLEAIGKADSQVAFIMPARLAQTPADNQIMEMVGSGPYRFIAGEYRSGSRAVYEKFSLYAPRGERADWATGGKVVHYDRIEWHVMPDPATAAAALRNGEVDWWEQPLADLLPQLARDKGVALQVINPQGRMSQMTLNHMQPPFDDQRLRRALLTGVVQDDFMRATFGDDQSLWGECQSMFPCGTRYETRDKDRLMKGDIAAARAQLKEAGYNGQKTVVMNPTDLAVVKPLGQVAADLLKRIGFNVELQETDWGTISQRRGNRSPVEQGGWSLFCTTGSATNLGTPVTSVLVRGSGPSGWYGGWSDPKAVALTQAWLDAPDEAERKQVASELAILAMTKVSTIPLGQYYEKTAFRRTIAGIPQGVLLYPWGVHPA